MKKIVFFVQTKKPIGGSQVMFLDLATYIASHYSDYDVYYINYPNPQVEQLYGSAKVHFCDVDRCDYSQFDDAVFFTPINYVFYLMNKIKNLKSSRICLYFYHPQIFDWLGMQIGKAKPNFEPLLRLIANKDACCFMDKSNYLAATRLSNVDFQKTYVPVPLHDFEHENITLSDVSEETIRVGWLGRLDFDKIYSLINLADNLVALKSNKKIDLYVVGDGNGKAKLNLDKYCPQIRFIFTSYMYGEERNKFFSENVDLVVAMGMSAIDMAVLGIPTVIPIVSNIPFNTDLYSYIFDVKDYSLGWDLKDRKEMDCKSSMLEQIIKDIDRDKTNIGKSCKDFVIKEFSIEESARLLLKAVEKTSLTVNDCMKCNMISNRMRKFELYKKLRKRDEYESFHEFCARIKRINLQKGLSAKLKRILFELKKTSSK